jgi:branched-chain amino acid transport system permease protein
MESLFAFYQTHSHSIDSIGINMILALSMYMTLSTGMLSLANGAFMALGAYTAALLTMNANCPFLLAILVGALPPFIIAVLLRLLPVLRLHGVFLSIATIGFGEIVKIALTNWEYTGGAIGLFVPAKTQLWHTLLGLIIAIYAVVRIKRSKIGRAMAAIAEDEKAAEASGINIYRYKVFVFVLGAVFAGIAGGLYAHLNNFIDPREFGFHRVVNMLVSCVIGGINKFVGVMIGAAFITILPEIFRFANIYRAFFTGLILLLAVLYPPAELGPIIRKIYLSVFFVNRRKVT